MNKLLPSVPVMVSAFARKDRSFEGIFIVAVKTTGIFCRPTCPAKPAKACNLEFYPTAALAMRQGYRPCKLCRPMERRVVPQIVSRLMDMVDRQNGERLTEQSLRDRQIDPSTARRQFKAYMGMTFSDYQRRRMMHRAMQQVSDGGSLITAQLKAGFKSSSGFRRAMSELLDAPFVETRAGQVLMADWIDTPIGLMLAITNDTGIIRLDFCDEGRAERLLNELRAERSRDSRPLAIVPGEHQHLATLHRELNEYFAGTRRIFTVPLAPAGTSFELKTWEFLRTIPYAQTRSYGEQARAIGNAGAARAVGRANGKNPIGVVVPCHRVIGASGALTGFGGGLARKQWLLDHERKAAGEPDLFR